MSAEQSFEKGRTQEKKDDTGEQDEAKKTENQIARTQLTRTANPNFTVINMNVGRKDTAISDQKQRKKTLEGILTSQRPSLVFVQELEGIGLNQTPFNDEVRNIYRFFRDDQVIVPDGGNRENIISKKPGFYYHNKVVECEQLDELSVKRCFNHVKTTFGENLQDSMVRNVFNRLCLCKITNKQIPTFELLCACWHGVYKDSIIDRAEALRLMLRFLLILKVQYRNLPLLLAGDFNLTAKQVSRLLPPTLVIDSPYDESIMLWIRSNDFEDKFEPLNKKGVDYTAYDHVVLKMELEFTVEDTAVLREETKNENKKPNDETEGSQQQLNVKVVNVGPSDMRDKIIFIKDNLISQRPTMVFLQETQGIVLEQTAFETVFMTGYSIWRDQGTETKGLAEETNGETNHGNSETQSFVTKPGFIYDNAVIECQSLNRRRSFKILELVKTCVEGNLQGNLDKKMFNRINMCKISSKHSPTFELLYVGWQHEANEQNNPQQILRLLFRFLLMMKVECGNLPLLLVGDFDLKEIGQLTSHKLVPFSPCDESKMMWILSDDFDQTFKEVHFQAVNRDVWKIELQVSTNSEQFKRLLPSASVTHLNSDSDQSDENEDNPLKISRIQRSTDPSVQMITASWHGKHASFSDEDKEQSFRWSMRFLLDQINRRDPTHQIIGVNNLAWVLKAAPNNDNPHFDINTLDTWIISNDKPSLLKVKRKSQSVDQFTRLLPSSKTFLKAEIEVRLDIVNLKLESSRDYDYILEGYATKFVPIIPAPVISKAPVPPEKRKYIRKAAFQVHS